MLDHAKKDCKILKEPHGKSPVTAEYGNWLRAKPPRILGAHFHPPTRRGQYSSSDKPQPHSPKTDHAPTDPYQEQPKQNAHETRNGNNSDPFSAVAAALPQDDPILIEAPVANVANQLPSGTDSVDSPTFMFQNIPPLVPAFPDEDAIMLPASECLVELSHPHVSRRNKRSYEKISAPLNSDGRCDEFEARASKISKPARITSDATEMAEATGQPRPPQ
ncbi:hypothetical protein M569_13208 [Genlisea aurea]|uniref:Uncharacterized protein n=1 Tax=Genlisea aurea TaxID=192259 RepID=S8DFL0_9LAMI|nr:hypothetical protein M569_13208 [Genlisea aurea]